MHSSARRGRDRHSRTLRLSLPPSAPPGVARRTAGEGFADARLHWRGWLGDCECWRVWSGRGRVLFHLCFGDMMGMYGDLVRTDGAKGRNGPSPHLTQWMSRMMLIANTQQLLCVRYCSKRFTYV